MTRRRIRSTALLGCFAAAGLVGAHVLAYRMALPDGLVRAAVLRTTGHGYLGPAIVIATVAFVFGLIGSAAVGFAHGRRHSRGIPSWRYAALRIAATQTGGFVMLEFAERVVVGRRPVAFDVALLCIGIVVQIVLACAAAAVLVLVGRAAHAVGRASRTPLPVRLQLYRSVFTAFDVRAPRLLFAGAQPVRGPPSSPR
jgi:hypothetical protein